MRRRIQIVVANSFLVATLVCSGSYVYVSQTLRQRVTTANDNATYINSQIEIGRASCRERVCHNV